MRDLRPCKGKLTFLRWWLFLLSRLLRATVTVLVFFCSCLCFDWREGGYSVGVLAPVVVGAGPPRGSVHELGHLPRGAPVELPGIRVAGRMGPVVAVKREVRIGRFVPAGTGSVPVTGTSVLITVTDMAAAFGLIKSGRHLSSLLGLSFVVHPPGGTGGPGTVR